MPPILFISLRRVSLKNNNKSLSEKDKGGTVKASKDAAEPLSSRWWESYLVRYFPGFIVGTLCTFILVSDFPIIETFLSHFLLTESQVKELKIKPDWTIVFLCFSMMGVLYTYISSSPITVLHTGRNEKWFIDSHSRHFWFGWLAGFLYYIFEINTSLGGYVALIIACIVIILWMPISRKREGYTFLRGTQFKRGRVMCSNTDRAVSNTLRRRPLLLLFLQSFVWSILIFSLFKVSVNYLELKTRDHGNFVFFYFGIPAIWIGLVQYVVLFRLLVNYGAVKQFYIKLVSARRHPNSKDIRESYTHLREHSNSVFIIIVELTIFSFLWGIKKSFPAIALVKFIPFLIFIWCVPTLFLWSRANEMERYFATNPQRFTD